MAQSYQFFQQSQLALAAYAVLTPSQSPAQYVAALIDQGMPDRQAQEFSDRYIVIDQFIDATGLSATVFQEIGGQRYLAIRGTESIGDFVADTFILAGWPSFLNPQFLTLRTQVQRWMDTGVLPSSYTITGHSLGGYLAAATGSWFNANNAGTYLLNSPGIGGVVGNVTDSFIAALGLGDVALVGNIQNIRASAGISLISGLGSQLASPMFIETELSADPFANHSIVTITDSLSVYALLEQLNPEIGVNEAAEIFKTASSRSADTLVAVVAPLAKIFGSDDEFPGDREALYRAIYSIEAQVPTDGASPFKLVSLTEDDAEALAIAANGQSAEGLAYRYALWELNPFVVLGADYSQFNVNGALDIYDPEAGVGLTQAYLDDRATMLSWKNDYYRQDGNLALRSNHIETLQYIDKNIKDESSGGDLTLTVVGSQLSAVNNPSKVIFGGDDADVLMGSDIAAGDRLYGRGGDDTLQGNPGDDYLEGGAGDDIYIWNTGDGFDTILDTDGIGRLVVNGVPVSGAIQVSANDYISADKKLLMHFEGYPGSAGALIVNGDMRIEDFESGDLDIVLGNDGDASQLHSTESIFANPFSQTYPTVGFGTNIADYADVGADSIFLAKGGDDFLVVTGTGGAKLFAGPGDDVIVGGDLSADDADTVLYGEAGADILLGGEKDESIFGDFSIFTYSPAGFALPSFSFDAANFLSGDFSGYGNWSWADGFRSYEEDFSEIPVEPFTGSYVDAFKFALGIADNTDLSTFYDDYIEGGGGNDRITGGNGSDVLFGGSGNDVLIGDGLLLLQQDSYPTPQWLTDLLPLFGAAGDDYLDGGPGNDVLEDGLSGNGGSGGNDVLIGGEGDDILTNVDPASESLTYTNFLDGDEGDDTLQSSNNSFNGVDLLDGGPGNDSLTVATRGSADMSGGAGNDSLTVGALGNANMDGGAGSDSYSATYLDPSFLAAFLPDALTGRVVIREQDEFGLDSNTLSVDLWSIGELPLSITRDESNLYIGSNEIPQWLTVENWFVGMGHKIEAISISTADLSGPGPLPPQVYDIAAIESRFTTTTDGPDFLWGSRASDQLNGALGSDHLFGAGGDDLLAGNEGEDTLDGGDGSDVYVFNVGDGIDHITDSGRGGSDGIFFGAGIAREMLSFDSTFQLLTVGGETSGDAIHLGDASSSGFGSSSNIEYLQFADGTRLSFQQFMNPDLYLEGGSGGNTFDDGGSGDPPGDTGGSDLPDGGQGASGGDTGAGAGHIDETVAGDSGGSIPGIQDGAPDSFASPPSIGLASDFFSAPWQVEQEYQFDQTQSTGNSARSAMGIQSQRQSRPQFESAYDNFDQFQRIQVGGDQTNSTVSVEGASDHRIRYGRGPTPELLDSYLGNQWANIVEGVDKGWGQSGYLERALSPAEVAARWQRVDQYMKGLVDSQDEDARQGATDLHFFDAGHFLGAGEPGAAFGFSGSTGSTRGYANLKTLAGLKEGFQLLRS